MTHERFRFLTTRMQEHAKFWPVVGLLGPRQSGKTTLLRSQLGVANYVTLDDEFSRQAALSSATVFLSKLELPVVIDEIQKAPDLFDAIKVIVDKKRIPGRFFISGSTQFSSKLGIRESLTGRIATNYLHPLTIAEGLGKAPRGECKPIPKGDPRISLANFVHHAHRGGMPVPMFVRDASTSNDYWSHWLETAVYKDLARLIPNHFDPEFALEILRRMARIYAAGDFPTLRSFKSPPAKTRKYLVALEEIFCVRRMRGHEQGTGKEFWMFFDSGLCNHLMQSYGPEDASLALVRHCLYNETTVTFDMAGERDPRTYYQNRSSAIIDWIWNDVPMKIVTNLKQIGWQERALAAGMKKIGATVGYLVAPVEKAQKTKRGIGLLPWTSWS